MRVVCVCVHSGDNLSPRGKRQSVDVASVDYCKVHLSAYLCEHERRLCCHPNGMETTLRIVDRGNAHNTKNAMDSITSSNSKCADTKPASARTLALVEALENRRHGMRYCLPCACTPAIKNSEFHNLLSTSTRLLPDENHNCYVYMRRTCARAFFFFAAGGSYHRIRVWFLVSRAHASNRWDGDGDVGFIFVSIIFPINLPSIRMTC